MGRAGWGLALNLIQEAPGIRRAVLTQCSHGMQERNGIKDFTSLSEDLVGNLCCLKCIFER